MSPGALSFPKPPRELLEKYTVFLRSNAFRILLASSLILTYISGEVTWSLSLWTEWFHQVRLKPGSRLQAPLELKDLCVHWDNAGGESTSTRPASNPRDPHDHKGCHNSFITSSPASSRFLICSSPHCTRGLVNDAKILNCPSGSASTCRDLLDTKIKAGGKRRTNPLILTGGCCFPGEDSSY